jgi:hypothetical protein
MPEDDGEYFDKPEYEVSVRNTFHADNYEDAVRQMIEWLQDNAAQTGYRVSLAGSSHVEFIDGEEV